MQHINGYTVYLVLKFLGGIFREKITRKTTGGWEGDNKTKLKPHGDTLRFPEQFRLERRADSIKVKKIYIL